MKTIRKVSQCEDVRTRRVFLWIPKTEYRITSQETRWLEWATITERYTDHYDMAPTWEFIRFEEK